MSVWCCFSQCFSHSHTLPDPGNAVWSGAVTFPQTQGPPQGHAGAELRAGKVQSHRDFQHSTIYITCKYSPRHKCSRAYKHLSCTRTVQTVQIWLVGQRSPISAVRNSSECEVLQAKCCPFFLHNGTFCCITIFNSPRWSRTRTVVLISASEARYPAVSYIRHSDQKSQEACWFSPEWETRAREIGNTAAGAQWRCQIEKWGVNSRPVDSHMSGRRKQQFEEKQRKRSESWFLPFSPKRKDFLDILRGVNGWCGDVLFSEHFYEYIIQRMLKVQTLISRFQSW